MLCKTNAGGGGSTSAWAYISVSYPAGSTCSATNGTITLAAKGTSGSYVFQIPQPTSTPETWTVSCTNSTQTSSDTVSISDHYQCANVLLNYGRLPAEYQEVEYLTGGHATSGSNYSYIDTGIIATLSSIEEIEIEFAIPSTYVDTNCYVFGVGSTQIRLGVYCNNGTQKLYPYYNNYASTNLTFSFGTRYSLKINDANHKIICNNTELATISTFPQNGTYSPYLFSLNNMNARYGTGRSTIYSYIKRNNSTNEIIQDLVPCYRKSDNVAGMYDIVNETFKVNDGEGTFTVGPDV